MEGYPKLREMYQMLPETLKKEQEAVIQFVCDGKHVLCILPTGYGKSLTFTIPPLLLGVDKVALVVSPLVALMANQVESLNRKGIPAVAITAEMSADDRKRVKAGDLRIVFVSPEALEVWMGEINSEIYQKRLCVIAFDEVHILSQWGETFRPSFQTLGRLRSLFENVPILMLSATLSEEARGSVLTSLHLRMDDVQEVFKYPDRPNIHLKLKSKSAMRIVEEMKWYLDELMQKKKTCPKCIIYINGSLASMGKCYRDVRMYLNDDDDRGHLVVDMFHASLHQDDRERKLTEFSKPDSDIRLLLATSAFGMGIDINDIRYVVLWGAPSSASEVWQEIGRAGRDGKQSEARLLFTPQSIATGNKDKFLKELSAATSSSCIRQMILSQVFYKKVEATRKHDETCCTVLDK